MLLNNLKETGSFKDENPQEQPAQALSGSEKIEIENFEETQDKAPDAAQDSQSEAGLDSPEQQDAELIDESIRESIKEEDLNLLEQKKNQETLALERLLAEDADILAPNSDIDSADLNNLATGLSQSENT